MVKISPSILSADFAILGAEVENIKNAGAEMAHIDVMDGIFVTNMSFAFPIISSLRKVTDMFLDVHLMIDRPERYIDRFIDSGADLITFHLEATNDADLCIDMIKKRGKKVSVSIKPNTPIESVYPYLDRCDMVLIMTVEPGYGGQSLIPECLDKVKALKTEIEKRNLSIDIQVDGGINEKTAKDAVAAGANVLVAGSAVFNAKDRKVAIDALR